MRVGGGTARGRRINAPQGIRPTSDLVRGAIFDTLDAQSIDISRVLDLYAGSGALGIEALSRGSEWCDFVEQNTACAAMIKENLASTGLAERAKVYRLKVEQAAARLDGPYNLVLADPPYDDTRALEQLERVGASGLLAPEAALVLEQSSRSDAPETLGPLAMTWTRRYGDTQVSIYRRPNEEERS